MLRGIRSLLKSVAYKRFINSKYASVFESLKPGEIAIDCGANIGEVTGRMANRGLLVYAFEPNIAAYNELSLRFSDSDNVCCFQKGVWYEDGLLPLFHHNNSKDNALRWSTGSSFLSNKNNVTDELSVKVEVIDLARFITELKQPISLLKIDIEGAEYDVLSHLIKTGAIHNVKKALVETHANKNKFLQAKHRELVTLIDKEKLTDVIDLNWR